MMHNIGRGIDAFYIGMDNIDLELIILSYFLINCSLQQQKEEEKKSIRKRRQKEDQN